MRLVVLAVMFSLALLPASAQEAFDDRPSPQTDAVARIGICTATLIAPRVLLTAGHCVPESYRQKDGEHAMCKGLAGQLMLAKRPRAADDKWTDLAPQPAPGPGVKFAAAPTGPGYYVGITGYAIAHCADMALLRLAGAVPPRVAIPMPAMTEPPKDPLAFFATARLRYEGYGFSLEHPRGMIWRQAGRVGFWGMNRCNIFALPPERAQNGPRILKGDSGSPLIVETDAGPRVAGVLFGSGAPDVGVCGWPEPRLPGREGTYTPTFRGPLDETGATDLGKWIEEMVAAVD